MRPLIGVIPLYDENKNSLWMLPGYFDGVTEAGGIPVMLPLTSEKDLLKEAVERCDGILFTGGHDVSPELYHEPVFDTELCSYCPERDRMERIVLEIAMEKDLAVLGICRGLQFINATLGGTLYQDLPSQHPSPVSHRQKPPYDQPSHTVILSEDTPLYRLVCSQRIADSGRHPDDREESTPDSGHTSESERRIPVNSCHHQAVRKLAPGLTVMAVAEDGVIEAVCHPGKKFLWAVQWHPEFSHKTDPVSRAILRAFTEAAK